MLIESAPDAGASAHGTEQTKDKLSIIMFSGTADKFIPLGVLAQAAAAMGMEVDIFVTGFALLGFTKKRQELPFPAEFASMAPSLARGMEQTHVASWDTMLRSARELGAKVHACSMMSSVMGLGQGDFNDLVDDVVGAATFLQTAEGGQTLFIGGDAMSQPAPSTVIDSRGSACPGPITDLAMAYRRAKVGDVLELWATDPESRPMSELGQPRRRTKSSRLMISQTRSCRSCAS